MAIRDRGSFVRVAFLAAMTMNDFFSLLTMEKWTFGHRRVIRFEEHLDASASRIPPH
jgi:hypothetical protein